MEIEQSLSDRANRLAYERLQYFKGRAVVNFKFFQFEVPGKRHLSQKNVERLLSIFTIEGCGNLEPEHRIAVLVNSNILEQALASSGISSETLLNPTTQPRLVFEGNQQLQCLYGIHRVKAGEAFGKDCWLTDIYLDGMQYSNIGYNCV